MSKSIRSQIELILLDAVVPMCWLDIYDELKNINEAYTGNANNPINKVEVMNHIQKELSLMHKQGIVKRELISKPVVKGKRERKFYYTWVLDNSYADIELLHKAANKGILPSALIKTLNMIQKEGYILVKKVDYIHLMKMTKILA